VPLLLARIDDRLIHGQVAHGWGRALHPTLLAIVSDSLRNEPDRAELYLFAVPEGARGRVVSVAEALDPSFRNEVDAERTILLFAGPEDALRLLEGGFPLQSLNVGGLHHASGRREVLPYVFLDEADRARLRALQRRGVRVYAQDLPSNSSHAMDTWVGEAT
jgi:mannose/fructose/N-acetylgalactosamine-specific phosphotransferase system component IIB